MVRVLAFLAAALVGAIIATAVPIVMEHRSAATFEAECHAKGGVVEAVSPDRDERASGTLAWCNVPPPATVVERPGRHV